MSLWSEGRYDAVGDRIAGIAAQTVAAANRRRPISGAAVLDLACGTGSAALAAAEAGANVTGVDVTPELMAIGAQKPAGRDITWVTADAADTGLPAHAFDAVVSNMGIIFVAPDRQVAELTRLLKPAGVLAFSSWVRLVRNPLFDPIIAVFGTPPATGFRPDQWGDPDVVSQRLAIDFDDIEIENSVLTWEFASLADAMRFVEAESPMHVDVFNRADETQRQQLTAGFESNLKQHETDSGAVSFDAPYVVVTATRR